ncbi:MAG: GlsB/YeaQ/YmgE family stress response membrane protein [Actinomycetota bacterium]|nr:GlsB/YeaQ/YmgE family stress response membrane protein [Actinomycetota bacterium]
MTIESLLWFLIVLALIGLIVGAVARVLVPGPTPMGVLATIGAGIAGALIGGFVGRLLLGPNLTNGWSFVLSVLAAAAVVALVSGRGRRSYYYEREPVAVYDRTYDDRVIVDDDRPYRRFGFGRRRRFF